MTTDKSRAEIAQEVCADLEAQVAEMTAALDPSDQSIILTYDNGLCIGLDATGHPFACGIMGASTEVYGLPTIRNGHGEQAKLVKRQEALARNIATTQALITDFRTRWAELETKGGEA